MSRREWLLSVLFAAFVALKIAEGVFAIERWPLSNLPMYAARHPVEEVPQRAILYGYRHGAWFEMQPFLFGLNRDELRIRIRPDDDAASECGALVRAFNARRPPGRRVGAAYVHVQIVPRPPEPVADQHIDCSLDAERP